MGKETGNVTKAELAQQLARVGISCRHARNIVEFFFEQWASALRRGEVVHLVGFGAFRFKVRPPRMGRNPRTGARVSVPAKRIIQFKAGKELKALVRGEAGKNEKAT